MASWVAAFAKFSRGGIGLINALYVGSIVAEANRSDHSIVRWECVVFRYSSKAANAKSSAEQTLPNRDVTRVGWRIVHASSDWRPLAWSTSAT